ncbi:ABC transporter permease [Dyadobacter chenwenxiniae]|uniref:ABC transporter permease n=1 Tax=Dyadobacter chenwenxiniae TaxID=2906456 RepID=A0A9X1TCL9_9BACT|nr:ABC transporter permease [Dyadobacter chenwenxiniae]MCF0060986.1 ABC transporter permease [Dyadobacter chenwenxiniae]UON80815.1 ABC transporter permease [Dyadobacter chenwenxiniae]
MFKTFLKIACRHLWQTKLYAFINVTGLAIGTVCVLLAVIYLADEHGYDQFHAHNPNLYRITTTYTDEGKATTTGGTGQVQGPAFSAQIPEIRHYARIMGGDIYSDVRAGERALNVQLLFADSSFFDVFSFHLLHGHKNSALKSVHSVVLTEKTARKFFNRTDVVGRILQMDADPSAMRLGKPLVVSAVVENPPVNSSIQFDMLSPFAFLQVSFDDKNWLSAYLGTFVVLHPRANYEEVIGKFNRIHKMNTKSTKSVAYGLQRITDIHLNPQEVSNQNREAGIINGSKPIYSLIFLGLAAFILLMASINFINISIANAMRRAKEVGIRKATGSSRMAIMLQFLGESAIINILAFVCAIGITISVLSVYNQLADKQFTLTEIIKPSLMLALLGILSINIIVSGLYPAYLLANFNPITALNNRQKLSSDNLLGRGLLVFQFAIAIALGIATMVFYRQMQFIQSKTLGYNPHQIVKIRISGVRDVHQVTRRFRDLLKENPSIKHISLAGEFGFRDVQVGESKTLSYVRTIDEKYVDLMQIMIANGRNFSDQFRSDREFGVLVNEAFVKAAEIKNPVGAQIRPQSDFAENLTIIGITKDFHYGSFKQRIQPLIMPMSDRFGGDALWVKVEMKQQTEALALLERTFKKVLPGAVFNYNFLDQQNALEYKTEMRWQKIIGYATAISIAICCMGLFGLTHLSTARRTKETAIRMVLGATAAHIAILFSRSFLLAVAIAILCACPVSYYLLNLWLSDFAYRIDITWWMFAITGSLAFVLTLTTVSSQAFLAALKNPVSSLRAE